MAVYAVEATGLGFVKIGYCGAFDLTPRLSALQVGCPVPLALRRVFTYLGRRAETEMHLRFRAHRTQGEWFRLVPEINAWIDSPERDHETVTQRDADRYARVQRLGLVPVPELRERLAAEIRSGRRYGMEILEALRGRVSQAEYRAWLNPTSARELYPDEVRRIDTLVAL